ncbi:DUF2254 domain-containing protein [Demequina sp. NBRC 110053]|uniref:DUF2254 domain-containing protein n=1 Tax=Demequina sp. NBRC 110053 TaxID=1570342 RepID=UPI001184B370|nr:DUF2254 domain-containing protein [Demequina sp. NBRC 110053]
MNGERWRMLGARLGEQIWWRLVLFTIGALLLVVAAWLLGPYLPTSLTLEFGQDSVANILQILATSMLAVTTFSLTAMISAYAAAARGTTPRATQLLISDPTSQNALSTFLGTFVFAIVGIVALSTQAFTEQGKSVLFLGTLVVIAIVVGTLLRWIHHLTGFGRVPDVLDRVEAAATDAARAAARRPHLGGQPAVAVPRGARAVRSGAAGIVTGILMEQLHGVAEDAEATVHVVALPGVTVGHGEPLAWVLGGEEREDCLAAAAECFRVEKHRSYEQDPRLGFVALAEIGSRALSPSTNDPGTAIEALNAVERVMTRMMLTEQEDGVDHPRVHVPAPDYGDVIEDALRPIARDGATLVEIGLRVQRVVRHLLALADEEEADALRAASERAERRALAGLTDEGDRALVRDAAREARDRST